ncbi:PCI domain [Rhizoctonia solani]|uniref:PCI domain n=1 Tax=Rhizoctonia solani TaxID=456999 RepID=A0A8H7HEP0_9AGAM|nr:PCI domain [Rhizoctonia solani]
MKPGRGALATPRWSIHPLISAGTVISNPSLLVSRLLSWWTRRLVLFGIFRHEVCDIYRKHIKSIEGSRWCWIDKDAEFSWPGGRRVAEGSDEPVVLNKKTSLEAKYNNTMEYPWSEIIIAYSQVLVHTNKMNWQEAYKEQSAAFQAFLRYFITQTRWVLPVLKQMLQDLKTIAELADEQAFKANTKAPSCMEDTARLANKAFSNCVTDRTSSPSESRKWGIYYVVGIVMKCYFKVNRIALSRNIMRAIHANADIPPLEQYPRADQVTYKYYVGLINFLNENHQAAEEDLTYAFYHCHRASDRNQELILTYLVPLRLCRGILPSNTLFTRFPRLGELYSPFVIAIKNGDLRGYDEALLWAERRLTDMGTYLTVEKAREICVRELLRKVWLVHEKFHQVPISLFHAGFLAAGQEMEAVEAECMVANMIHKGYIRGYISHEKQTAVLSKTAAFPAFTERKSA